MAIVTRKFESVQYNGTNGTYIANTWLTDMQLISDTGNLLTLGSGEDRYPVPNGWWVVRDSGATRLLTYCSPAEYASSWAPVMTATAALLSMGSAVVPSLLASASVAVAVPLSPAMPDTAYMASAVLTASASILASLAITSIVRTSGTVLTVTVQNTGLITLSGATAIATAVRVMST
ncbi:hypothetical protein ACIQ1S_09365 [Streptomyces griseus]|uniref:hypothetical protein n=1 Tax=Streptomyces griseus TaxID=1911 RepID=UPI00369D8BF1